MFISRAIVKYDDETDILRAHIEGDLDKYYKKLFERENHLVQKMWCGRYGAHITIYRPEIHGVTTNWPQKYDGDIVEFQYNPNQIYQGGHYRGFIGFYLPVYSFEIESIKKNLGIWDKEGDSLHLTLFHNKKEVYEKQKSGY